MTSPAGGEGNSEQTATGLRSRWTATGAVFAGLAVICGAFAAHGLDGWFATKYAGETRTRAGQTVPAAEKYLRDFQTGAEYQMYHALGLIGVGLAMQPHRRRMLTLAGWSFLGGIVLFSGSLYALTLTGHRWMGMITPLGGLLFIAGWLFFALGATRSSHH